MPVTECNDKLDPESETESYGGVKSKDDEYRSDTGSDWEVN